ncbi:hypothetical protein ABBQ38_012757 [Trebouxia sp. C0009 RCD-2024]
MSQDATAVSKAGPSTSRVGLIAATSVQVALWRVLYALSRPFRQLLALQVFLGRSVYTVFVDFQRSLWGILGWFSAPPRTLRLRKLGRGYFRVRRWHGIVVTVLLIVSFNTLKQRIQEMQDPSLRRQKQLRLIMKNATHFSTWNSAVKELVALQGKSQKGATAQWRRQTRLYDQRLLQQRLRHLQAVRQSGNLQQIIFALRQDLLRNLGNMTNSELHEHFLSVPEPIRLYIEEVKTHLLMLTNYNGPSMTLKEKWEFIKLTRHAFGRTALVLSGGGALGAFHLGVCKSLFQHGLLPRVMAGSSVGSIVAAIVATRNDDMLRDLFKHMSEFDLSFFSNSTASQFVRHFLLKGTLQDIEVLQKRLRRLLGDLTFLEAFILSDRVLNVAVSAADTNEPPRVLNYLTAPNVVVWSAVACSSAFPYLFKPQELLSKNEQGVVVSYAPESEKEASRRWRDGSLEEDLPMRTLSEMFNVNYFLVSQTNPHIVPALNMKRKFNRKLGNLLEAEWKHRCNQLQQVLPGPISKWLKVLSQPWEGDVTMVLPSTYSQIKKAVTNPSKRDLQIACLQGEQSTWAKLSAIKSNCGIEVCLDKCLRELEHQSRLAREDEANRRREAGMPPSRIAEEGAAATGDTEGRPGSSSGEGYASPRQLGRSSSVGMGSGESQSSGRGPTWSQMPRSHGQRVTARIPSWLHLPSLGMESAQSEDNLDSKAAGSNPSLTVMANSSRAYSSDDLRSMGAPMSGPSGMPLMTGRSLDTVKESEVAGSEYADGASSDDGFSLDRADSGDLSEFPDWQIGPAQDCCDTSANIMQTLNPLHTSANSQSIGHGLDFIAP